MDKIVLAAVVSLATAGCPREANVDSDPDREPPALVLPTPAELATMSEAERATVMARSMEAVAAQPDLMVDEAMDMARQPVMAAAGEFTGVDTAHNGSGRVLIYQLPDDSYIIRLEEFRVTNGPALVVALAAHPNPRSSGDVEKGYVSIGALKGNVGNQNYEVPAQFDVFSFGAVVIWCEAFGVMFATAPLKLL